MIGRSVPAMSSTLGVRCCGSIHGCIDPHYKTPGQDGAGGVGGRLGCPLPLREVAGQFERPALLFSGGKDSITLVHLALKFRGI